MNNQWDDPRRGMPQTGFGVGGRMPPNWGQGGGYGGHNPNWGMGGGKGFNIPGPGGQPMSPSSGGFAQMPTAFAPPQQQPGGRTPQTPNPWGTKNFGPRADIATQFNGNEYQNPQMNPMRGQPKMDYDWIMRSMGG